MKILSRAYGYTMMELIIVITILGLLAAGSMQLIFQGYQAYSTGKQASDANWQGLIALSRMGREIHLIASPNSIDSASTASTLTFTDNSNTTITYSLSGTNLQRAEGATAAQNLADGISSMTLNYYDSSGTAVTPPLTTTTAATIDYVQITLVILKNNASYTLQTTINARNL
jgi:prepilin-type N-terminal cleavage/methylation domain-containing protein